MGYYDAVLGIIPVTLLGLTGLLYGAGLELTVAVPAAATTAAAVVAHAMFVRAPVDGAVPKRRDDSPGFRPAD